MALMLVLFGTVGCNEEVQAPEPTNNFLLDERFEKFEQFGLMHNQFLDNTVDNFIPPTGLSYEKKLDYFLRFNLEYVSSVDLNQENQLMLKESLREYKVLFDSKVALDAMMGGKQIESFRVENIEPEILINSLYENEVVDIQGFKILENLTYNLRLHHSGDLSNQDLLVRIKELINDFCSQRDLFNSEQAMLIGSLLSVSKHSLSWWIENHDMYDGSNPYERVNAVPAWVGIDIVGGIVGGCASAFYQKQANPDQDLNWEIVGMSVVGGAVISSSGIIPKVGKWLASIL